MENLNISQIEKDRELPVKKQWYRVEDLSKYLSVSKSSIWNYSRQGIITAYKLGQKCTVFNIDEVEQALLSKRGA